MMSVNLPSMSPVPQLLQAFSIRTGLTIALLDNEGKRVRAMAPDGARESFPLLARSTLSSWKLAVDIGLADVLPGLKMFFLPIQAMGESAGLLVAGMLLEPGSRSDVAQYLAAHLPASTDVEEWLAMAIEVEPDTKRALADSLKALSEILGTLFSQERQAGQADKMLEELARLGTLADEGDMADLLDGFLGLPHGFDLVGFAALKGEECVITHCMGLPAGVSLVGSACMIGEGFVGQTAASGLSGVWQGVRDDPRAWLFHRHGIAVDNLFCWPVMGEEALAGVLFAGSPTCSVLSRQQAGYGMVFANQVRQLLSRQRHQSQLVKQSQRIRVLKEIVHLLAGTQDAEKLAFMLVDMSMTLLSTRFSAITLFDGADMSKQVRIVSRGLAKQESEQYARTLLETSLRQRQRPEIRVPVVPSVRKTAWGQVLECPLFHHDLYGVLSVSADDADEDDASILATMAIVAATALHQRSGRHGSDQTLVHQLHQTVETLNPEAAERSVQLQELAALFSGHLGLPDPEQDRIRKAAMLYACPPALVQRLFADDPDLATVVADCRRLIHDSEQDPVAEATGLSAAGQLLGLLSRYLQADRQLDDVVWDRGSGLFREFSSFLARQLIQDRQVRLYGGEAADLSRLSAREREVFQLLVEGMSNRKIADALFISEHTVKNHITNIFSKLSIQDRAGAMAYYYKTSR